MVPRSSSITAHPDTAPPASRAAPSERLAELVHHLSGVPLVDARRAVHHNAVADRIDDPLAIVAGAIVQLRHQPRRPRSREALT